MFKRKRKHPLQQKAEKIFQDFAHTELGKDLIKRAADFGEIPKQYPNLLDSLQKSFAVEVAKRRPGALLLLNRLRKKIRK